jgi:hypothetical protein
MYGRLAVVAASACVNGEFGALLWFRSAWLHLQASPSLDQQAEFRCPHPPTLGTFQTPDWFRTEVFGIKRAKLTLKANARPGPGRTNLRGTYQTNSSL